MTTKNNVLNLLSTMLAMDAPATRDVTDENNGLDRAPVAREENNKPVLGLPSFSDTEMIPVRQEDGRLTNYPPPDKWDDWVEYDGKAWPKKVARRYTPGNRRIIRVASGKVTFRYRASDTGQFRICTLTAEEFLRRFLQHVLPKGFVKVRYYGLFSPARLHQLAVIRLWLDTSEPQAPTTDGANSVADPANSERGVLCPTCGQLMQLLLTFRPRSRCPP